MSEVMTFHDMMAVMREDSGMSIRELARETDLSPTTIQLAEKGADVRLSTLLSISRSLGMVVNINGIELESATQEEPE